MGVNPDADHLGVARLRLGLVNQQFDGCVAEPGLRVNAVSNTNQRVSELLRELDSATVARGELLGHAQLGRECT